MNENTLILTEHRLLPRLFDAALTLVAWGGFLFFLYARLWMQLTEESDHRWSVIIAYFNTVLLYLLFAALNGWLLILWYQYNRRRAHARRRQPGYFHQEELARSTREEGHWQLAAAALASASAAHAAGLPLDCLIIDLRACLEALGKITGDNASDDILAEIFSRFCIGK